MHEIITLQFGHYANHVGTHFWNTQEAHFNYDTVRDDEEPAPEVLNHDTLYRIGQNPKGVETYTPRVMIFDLKGGFGSMKKYNSLFASEEENSHGRSSALQWDSELIETHEEPEYPKSAYQQHLEDEEQGMADGDAEDLVDLDQSQTWSDFNRVYYHPASSITASGYMLESDFMPFDVFSYGKSCMNDTEKELDVYEENFRHFTEESDQIQGFNVLADVLDGWGGFATCFLEQVREDFPKTAITTFGLGDDKMCIPPESAGSGSLRTRQKKLVNETLSLVNLSDLSTMYIPVTAPTRQSLKPQGWSKYLGFLQTDKRYQTSGLISAALDTCLLPTRLLRNKTLMSDMCNALNWRNITNVATLSVGLPFAIGTPKLPELFGKNSCLYDFSSRKFDEDDQYFSQSLVLRGIETNQFGRYAANTPRMPSEILSDYLETLPVGKSLGNNKILTSLKYPIPSSYPRFFSGLTTKGGPVTGLESESERQQRADGSSRVQSVAVVSQLAISTSTKWQLEHLSDSVKKIDWRLLPEFSLDGARSEGVSSEEFGEAKEKLLDMYDIYNE